MKFFNRFSVVGICAESLWVVAGVAVFSLVGCATPGGSTPSASLVSTSAVATKSVYTEGQSVLELSKAGSERCLASASEFKGKSWKQMVKHANGCAKAGDWKKLELAAQEISRVEINSPWGAYFHSLVAENTGDLPRALWMMELAMKKAPGAGIFHFQKGRVLWRLQNYKDAVTEIKLAIQREPQLIDGHAFLAQVFHRDLDVDTAAKHYEKVIAIDPRHRSSLEGLADIRMSQGKFANAVELLTSAVSVSATDLRLRVKLAQAHEAIEGNWEQALASYRVAREIQGRSKGDRLEIDIADKIKTLEAKVTDANASKQAKLDGGAAASASRAPSNKTGGKK
ncbi:MAG: tetratricopeptide repeat protein [Bdellovibrionaceae bacterium]|nr:tetratricopeptide repeat protein [Pseudobdellovibrionaceae bacterium]